MVTLVRTLLSGAVVTGGGVSTLAFEDPADDETAGVILGEVKQFWDSLSVMLDSSLSYVVEGEPRRYAAIDGSLQQIFDAPSPGGGSGSQAGNAVPRSSQVLIRWNTAEIINGRLLRGRTFVPGLMGTAITDTGLVATSQLTQIAAAANALIDQSGGTLSVWSRPRGSSGGQTGLVTSASTWEQFAVLRSRRD